MRRLSIAPIVLFVVLARCSAAAQPPAPAAPAAAAPAPAATASAPAASNDPAIIAMIPTADGPIELAATDDSVWVENHRANILSRIDPAQNLEVERLPKANVHCEVAAGGGFVWATEAAGSSVVKVDAATGDVVDSIELKDACGAAANTEDVWVSSPGLGTVVRYDSKTAKERATVEVAPMVFFLAIGPEAVWVVGEADGGTAYRIDPATNKVVASISVPNQFATGVDVGHGSVWVPARESSVIYRIDPATNAVASTIEMPGWVGGLGVGPDAIWASGFGDGKVYRIDPATNQITASVSTGQGNLGPPLFAFGSVWVAALDQNVVLRIDPAAVH